MQQKDRNITYIIYKYECVATIVVWPQSKERANFLLDESYSQSSGT